MYRIKINFKNLNFFLIVLERKKDTRRQETRFGRVQGQVEEVKRKSVAQARSVVACAEGEDLNC